MGVIVNGIKHIPNQSGSALSNHSILSYISHNQIQCINQISHHMVDQVGKCYDGFTVVNECYKMKQGIA